MDVARELCEVGYAVTFYFISAWPSSESSEQIESHLYCKRIRQTIPVTYLDHFNKTIEGKVSLRNESSSSGLHCIAPAPVTIPRLKPR